MAGELHKCDLGEKWGYMFFYSTTTQPMQEVDIPALMCCVASTLMRPVVTLLAFMMNAWYGLRLA